MMIRMIESTIPRMNGAEEFLKEMGLCPTTPTNTIAAASA